MTADTTPLIEQSALQRLALDCEAARLAWIANPGNMARLDAYANLCMQLSHYFVPDILATIPAIDLLRAA